MRFKEGDDVWVPIPHVGVAKKFENRWECGWKVTEVKGPVNVSIQNRDGRIKTAILIDFNLIFDGWTMNIAMIHTHSHGYTSV